MQIASPSHILCTRE